MDAAIRLEQGVDGWRVSRRPQRVFVVERRCHGQLTLQVKCPPSHSRRLMTKIAATRCGARTALVRLLEWQPDQGARAR